MSTPPADEDYPAEVLRLAAAYHCEPAEVHEVRSLSGPGLEALTRAYMEEIHRDGPCYRRLQLARDLAVPYLIAVFAREDAFTLIPGSMSTFKTPASLALVLLDRGVHPELKTHLLRWLEQGDREIHRNIADHLVSFGTDDLLPRVKMLFEHPDILVSAGARGGVLSAVRHGGAEPAFLKYVWDHAVALLKSGRPPGMYDPIRLLVAIDAEETKNVLRDPAILRRENLLFAEVIGTLNRLGSPPDAAFLRSLLEEDPPARDGSQSRTQKAAIRGLILLHDPSACPHVERILAAPDGISEELVLAAWHARFRLRNLTPVYSAAFQAYEGTGVALDSLPADQRDIILMSTLDSEVLNGGLSQWYGNGFGIDGVDTWKALQKIGAKKHAGIIDRANRLFGPDGPPSCPERMERAITGMPDETALALSRLSTDWQDLPGWERYAFAWDWERQRGATIPIKTADDPHGSNPGD